MLGTIYFHIIHDFTSHNVLLVLNHWCLLLQSKNIQTHYVLVTIDVCLQFTKVYIEPLHSTMIICMIGEVDDIQEDAVSDIICAPVSRSRNN